MTRLVADIGGTSIRLGWQHRAGAALAGVSSFTCADFPSAAAAIDHFIQQQPGVCDSLVLAVAAPIAGSLVDITNNPWRFDAGDLARRVGAKHYLLINDFTAQALANAPLLDPAHQLNPAYHACIRAGRPDYRAPLLVTGPGTGLGVAAVVPGPGGPVVVEGEGGHVSYAPRNAAETNVLAALTSRLGHVSAERIVSGPGLETVFQIQTGTTQPAAKISAAALDGDKAALAAVRLMLDSFATVAANAALGFGAGAGIVIAGGIVPKLGRLFADSGFIQRLGDHGRRRTFLDQLPLYISLDPFAGLRGAAAAPDNPHMASRMVMTGHG
jgi:glucokinase